MRRMILLLLVAAAGVGGWWLWKDGADFRDSLMQYIENGELVTLEAKYTPEQIMEKYRKELLADEKHVYQDPIQKYHPHLLIEAKYTLADRKTREGVVLWSLVDGEMVLDTDSWEKTHGFADAIKANATRTDFKLMNALAKNGGSASKEQLQKDLHLEADILEPWVKSACQKSLVVQLGSEYQLHFQDPKILVTPQTKVKQGFVSKDYKHAQCVAKKYSRAQIERVAQAAFGPAFTIRQVSDVYLPVYGIGVLNPDGSVRLSYWNALNSQKM
ncbi:MAG: hypothetical protein H0X51_00685 [Parachlamydiaceae bacterium]|nr:hypothetical protein [Parachlamydiaceae bacterium]